MQMKFRIVLILFSSLLGVVLFSNYVKADETIKYQTGQSVISECVIPNNGSNCYTRYFGDNFTATSTYVLGIVEAKIDFATSTPHYLSAAIWNTDENGDPIDSYIAKVVINTDLATSTNGFVPFDFKNAHVIISNDETFFIEIGTDTNDTVNRDTFPYTASGDACYSENETNWTCNNFSGSPIFIVHDTLGGGTPIAGFPDWTPGMPYMTITYPLSSDGSGTFFRLQPGNYTFNFHIKTVEEMSLWWLDKSSTGSFDIEDFFSGVASTTESQVIVPIMDGNLSVTNINLSDGEFLYFQAHVGTVMPRIFLLPFIVTGDVNAEYQEFGVPLSENPWKCTIPFLKWDPCKAIWDSTQFVGNQIMNVSSSTFATVRQTKPIEYIFQINDAFVMETNATTSSTTIPVVSIPSNTGYLSIDVNSALDSVPSTTVSTLRTYQVYLLNLATLGWFVARFFFL